MPLTPLKLTVLTLSRWPQTPPTLLRWFCQVWRRIWWVYARKYPLKMLYSLLDSSPSPPERINDRARTFASHPSASYASHSGGAQRYQEGYESVTPEYTPSPGNYIDVQAHYDVPQRIRQAFSFLPSSFRYNHHGCYLRPPASVLWRKPHWKPE